MGIKEEIIKIGEKIGFNLIKIYKPERIEDEYLEKFIKEGMFGDMEYLKRNKEKILNPFLVWKDVKSILCCSVAYQYIRYEKEGKIISSFAVYEDYHKVIKRMLKEYLAKIKELQKHTEGKVFVDTGPVFEKEIAVRCGIGFRGKNTLVINQEFGSFFFLGEIFLNFPLEPDTPVEDGCGDCEKCVKSCPTGAIYEPYKLDPRRCISYLTIEKKDKDFSLKDTKGYIYGCDECQIVCKYNENRNVSFNFFDYQKVKKIN